MPFCQTWQNKHTSIQVTSITSICIHISIYVYLHAHRTPTVIYTVTCSINKLGTAHRQHFSISFLRSMPAMPYIVIYVRISPVVHGAWFLKSTFTEPAATRCAIKRTALTPTRKTAQMPLIFHGKTGNDHRGTFFAKGLYTAARSAGSSSCEDVPLPLWLGRHHRCLVFYTAGPMVPTCLERGFMECYTVTDIT